MDITVTIPAEEFADKLYEAVDKAVENLIAKDWQPVTHGGGFFKDIVTARAELFIVAQTAILK